MKMKKSRLRYSFFASLLLAGSIEAQAFSSLTVFGDSLSDMGANPSAVYSIYKFLGDHCDPGHACPPYYQGRISNGPVAAEYLAAAITHGAGASGLAGYAIAGSTTGVGNIGDNGSAGSPGSASLPGMAFQVASYLPRVNAGADALHMLWGGADDFLAGDSAQGAAQNMVGYVGALAAAGAKNILVPNLPDLSLTPYIQAQGLPEITAAHNFSVEFNAGLGNGLTNLGALFPDVRIIAFDTFGKFNDFLQNPSAYGFTNTTEACLSAAGACADPGAYVFWDSVHPTTQAYALFASELAASVVPLPGSLVLFGLGLAALVIGAGPSHRLA